jgi:hypothetical protein
MSGLEAYKISMPSLAFGQFYDRFLQNSFRQKRYRITLTSGDVVDGVPTVGSIADPRDPEVAFSLTTAEDYYRIPFRVLLNAEEL